jgi:hypothetical protein
LCRAPDTNILGRARWDCRTSLDSFKCRKFLKAGERGCLYDSLPEAEKHGLRGISRCLSSRRCCSKTCCATRIRQRLVTEIVAADRTFKRVPLICRIDTFEELDYFRNGGILHRSPPPRGIAA